jgi:hypothetical protein
MHASRPHPHPPSPFLPGRDTGIVLSPHGDLKQTQVSGTLTSSCFTPGMPSGPLSAHRSPRALRTRLNCIPSPSTARDRQKWSPSPRTALCQHPGSQAGHRTRSRDPRDPGPPGQPPTPTPKPKKPRDPSPRRVTQDPRTRNAAHPREPPPSRAHLPRPPLSHDTTSSLTWGASADERPPEPWGKLKRAAETRRPRPALPQLQPLGEEALVWGEPARSARYWGAEPPPCPRLFPRDPSHGKGRGHAGEERAGRRLFEWQLRQPVRFGVEGGVTKRRGHIKGRSYDEGAESPRMTVPKNQSTVAAQKAGLAFSCDQLQKSRANSPRLSSINCGRRCCWPDVSLLPGQLQRYFRWRGLGKVWSSSAAVETLSGEAELNSA